MTRSQADSLTLLKLAKTRQTVFHGRRSEFSVPDSCNIMQSRRFSRCVKATERREKSFSSKLAMRPVQPARRAVAAAYQYERRILHKVFAAAQLDLTIPDRFGHMVKPREWFLVPLHVIQEAVERVQDRTIVEYQYDATSAQMVKRSPL